MKTLSYISAFLLFTFYLVSHAAVAETAVEFSMVEKTVKPIKFFYGEYQLSGKDMHKQGDEIAQKTAFAIATKTSTVLDGPFTYIFENVSSFDPEKITAQIGWPVDQEAQPVGSFLYKETKPFKCLTTEFKGSHKDLPRFWKKLVTMAIAKGYKVTGEGRTLITLAGQDGYVAAHLQLGIM
ncbi:MAG: hypothetical protein MI864_04005 [Pseudomonadales bacterium]|nr:hypothetical protein [Pseudomonadales bacterium]